MCPQVRNLTAGCRHPWIFDPGSVHNFPDSARAHVQFVGEVCQPAFGVIDAGVGRMMIAAPCQVVRRAHTLWCLRGSVVSCLFMEEFCSNHQHEVVKVCLSNRIADMCADPLVLAVGFHFWDPRILGRRPSIHCVCFCASCLAGLAFMILSVKALSNQIYGLGDSLSC